MNPRRLGDLMEFGVQKSLWVDDFNGGLAMIYRGIKLPNVLGTIQNPRTGKPLLNQPGSNGMIEGFCGHCPMDGED